MTKLTRRDVLAALALGGVGAFALPGRLARAMTAGNKLKFLFVFAPGGWDPTKVFAPQFGNPNIDLEPGAQPMNIGNLTLVDMAERPNVRAFFEQNYQQTCLLNGVNVRSLSHEICTQRMLTGNTDNNDSDWATRLAAATSADYTLPHLNLSGPAFPGQQGTAFASAGFTGQLQGLLDGSILDASDMSTVLPSGRNRPNPVAERVVDNYLHRRISARVAASAPGNESNLSSSMLASLDRAAALKGRIYDMDFTPGFDLATQLDTAVEALATGISRCVSVSHPNSWDSHANNDQQQSPLFEDLFSSLNSARAALRARPGNKSQSLADETVLVVMSEMGRTPRLNTANGKDHWPYTSVLVVGPNITGNRVVGAFDSIYYGQGVDPFSAEIDTSSPLLTTEVLGATLLALADIDPAESLPGVAPLTGIIA